MYYTPASLIFRQAKTMNYNPKFLGVDGMDGILTLNGFDPANADGVIFLTSFNPASTAENTVYFVDKFRAANGEVPNHFAADAYDCVYAICQAVTNGKATAGMTAEEINDIMMAQFTSMSFGGVTGNNVTWRANGQVSKSPVAAAIKDGAYVSVE
jgi:branched-chain amino acid transport system substrate-binding protein